MIHDEKLHCQRKIISKTADSYDIKKIIIEKEEKQQMREKGKQNNIKSTKHME